MAQYTCVRKNAYYDSVTLMTLTNELKKLESVIDAVVSMATEMNKELAESIGLADDSIRAAKESDLIIGIQTESEEACIEASLRVDELLLSKKKKSKRNGESIYRSILQAKQDNEDMNMAVISVAGTYAVREADIALKNDMNVMLFSDNVSVEDEIDLKTKALDRGLFVMGPDCGTAIIDGIGLCFANDVKRGSIGVVAASGTGLQEVTVIIDKLGGGISQALGTGGRDLSAQVGGLMMLEGIDRLEQDEDTSVIVLVSKPPVPEVAEKVLARVETCLKPVVVCFIADEKNRGELKTVFAKSLEDAAVKAVAIVRNEVLPQRVGSMYPVSKEVHLAAKKLGVGQQYIRGLYCGGTLAAEALFEISKAQTIVYSNVAKKPEQKMADPFKSAFHTIVDLGDDVFTAGRPHPMIEPSLRSERLVAEAVDPEVAVVLLDFELGFGSNSDPVGATLDAIKCVKRENAQNNRSVVIIGYVLGTDRDYQGYSRACTALETAGVLLAKSNLHAIEMALSIIGEAEGGRI